MFVMTTKVDKKKILIAVIGVVVAVIAVIALLGGKDTQTSATNTVTGNDDRVQFITSFGWEVVTGTDLCGKFSPFCLPCICCAPL